MSGSSHTIPPTQDSLVYLIGYRATGKSTVAQRVAARLEWEWFDSDDLVQQRAGCSIAELFQTKRETHFRDLEEQTVCELSTRREAIVSLGGGAILRLATCQRVHSSGFCIWLKASPATVLQRLGRDPLTATQRPNLTSAGGLTEIQQLMQERWPIYQECSHAVVETDERTIEQVAECVLELIQRHRTGGPS